MEQGGMKEARIASRNWRKGRKGMRRDGSEVTERG